MVRTLTRPCHDVCPSKILLTDDPYPQAFPECLQFSFPRHASWSKDLALCSLQKADQTFQGCMELFSSLDLLLICLCLQVPVERRHKAPTDVISLQSHQASCVCRMCDC